MTIIPAIIVFLIINSVNIYTINIFKKSPLNAISINTLKLPFVVVNTNAELRKYDKTTDTIKAVKVAINGVIKFVR